MHYEFRTTSMRLYGPERFAKLSIQLYANDITIWTLVINYSVVFTDFKIHWHAEQILMFSKVKFI